MTVPSTKMCQIKKDYVVLALLETFLCTLMQSCNGNLEIMQLLFRYFHEKVATTPDTGV